MKLAEAKAKRQRASKPKPVPVVRDNTFHRVTVDNAFVLPLADSVEIACLQRGHDLTHVRVTQLGVDLGVEDVLTEVVRVRTNWNAALNLAMNVIGVGIATHQIDRAAILEKIAAMGDPEISDGK